MNALLLGTDSASSSGVWTFCNANSWVQILNYVGLVRLGINQIRECMCLYHYNLHQAICVLKMSLFCSAKEGELPSMSYQGEAQRLGVARHLFKAPATTLDRRSSFLLEAHHDLSSNDFCNF